MNQLMNKTNQQYLENQVFYSGFGEALKEQLAEKVNAGEQSFSLNHQQEFGGDKTEAILHFRRPDNSDIYFFNRYELSLEAQGKDPLKQTFFVGKENNITLKEAYNLMSGRAIMKEWTKMEKVGEGDEARYVGTDQKYKAWMQFDMKNTDAKGNFVRERYFDNELELDRVLSRMPLKEIQSGPAKDRLVESLQRGNRQAVSFIREDGEVKHYLEANPKDSTVNIYDDKMQRVSLKDALGPKQEKQQEEKNTRKQSRGRRAA